VFLPLTFLTGFFGMNFQGLPMDSSAFLWGAIAIMAAIPPILILWFKRSGWL
jgi:Mg2+ and Co2+ transporter CorA